MSSSLIFITGGSSGIGAAMARLVPYANARVINLSRRALAGIENHRIDLAEPAAWREAAQLFACELESFAGERVVFVHSAGTLEPIGFAGEVAPDAYARQVLLNSAAPQVLGDAFLRSARGVEADCRVVMITSGAAFNVYEGWSAYCAGKAAVDHWVRTVGAEQARRGNRCHVLAVAPGIVETPMQQQIRASAPRDFPSVGRFLEIHERAATRTPDDAAREIWSLLDRPLENGAVVDLHVPLD